MPTVEEVARLLTAAHVLGDAWLVEVHWCPSADIVRLVEVTLSIGDATSSGPITKTTAFRFAPDPPDVPYRADIVFISEGDWKRVKSRAMELPEEFCGQLTQLYQADETRRSLAKEMTE